MNRLRPLLQEAEHTLYEKQHELETVIANISDSETNLTRIQSLLDTIKKDKIRLNILSEEVDILQTELSDNKVKVDEQEKTVDDCIAELSACRIKLQRLGPTRRHRKVTV